MNNHRPSYRKVIDPHIDRSRLCFMYLISWALSIVLLPLLLGCGGGAALPVPVASTDYSQAQSWETLPSPSHGIDVFFVYPTTYSAPSGTLGPTWTPAWNQSLTQARNDTAITAQVTSKTGVFAKAGTNLYVPYFQQASGIDVLNAVLFSTTPQNASAANEALYVAYTDVANAFDYYMAHFNKDSSGNPRPFILAGHSQGSNLLLMLLENKFSDPALRKLLVAAYVIGWSVTADDLNNYPASLYQVGICGAPVTRTTGCIVTYNTQAYAGDWSQAPGSVKYGVVKANAYSVNPLTWVTSGPGLIESPPASATANLGALFYRGQLGSNPPVPFAPNPDNGAYTYAIANYTGAQSNNGGLVIDPSALPVPANRANLAPPYNVLPMFHNYDYNFFYRNLEQNVMDRIDAYHAQ